MVCAVVQEPAVDLGPEEEDLDVEDPGLYDLARKLTENALQEHVSPGPAAQGSTPDASNFGEGQYGRSNGVSMFIESVHDALTACVAICCFLHTSTPEPVFKSVLQLRFGIDGSEA